MKFLNHLTLGQYVPTGSIVHRADPRAKILATLFFLAGVFLADHGPVFALWTLTLGAVVALSRLPFSMVLRTARPVLFLILFTALIHLLFSQGTPIFRWGILKITEEGLRMAFKMGFRLFLLVLFAGTLTLTTSPTELADGLERLFSPLVRFGFPAHEMAMMMTIAIRFIPTLLDETDRIMKAQLARGADLDRGGIFKRLRAFIPVLVPLFVIVFQRADELAVAMESRNYRGGTGRTRMNPLVWRTGDSLALASSLLITVLFCFLDARLAGL
ncbi:MAG: energy-coupling factor transporter transmembrane component T family protein [Thermovirgaceae bacterium]